jgi:hypothetical protein
MTIPELNDWWWNARNASDAHKREFLGRVVRAAWIIWAKKQPNPKPHWLLEYDDLSEPEKEVDRQIAEAVERGLLIWNRPAHGIGIEKKEEALRQCLAPTPQ